MSGQTDRMATLLDDVHAALMAADYARLGPLTTEMEAEVSRLEGSRDAAALARVKGLAQRNAACLQAAQRGFRAARRRLAEITAARSGLVTYDIKGRRAEPNRGGELTKRC